MKRFLCFLSIIVLSKLCFTQIIKPFVGIDGHYGIQNKMTGKTLIDTKFKQINQFNDSMIVVVDDKGNYAIIDTLEHILLPYSKYNTGFIDYDSINTSKFTESPYRNDKGEISYYTYIVDRNRNCIPSDYYPCPCWKSITKDTVAEYLSLIQKAMSYTCRNMGDSAKFYCEKAISSALANPYVYLKRAFIEMIDQSGKTKIKNTDTINVREKNRISECLELAEKYEKNSYYKTYIRNMKYQWYKELKDKAKCRKIENQLKQSNVETFRHGCFLIPTISYINGIEAEIGIGNGYINEETSFKKKWYQQGLILYGASWSKNFDQHLDGYKLYLLSFVKTVNAGIYPILYTNYKKSEFVLKFEAGMGYSCFAINLGYNLHASGEKFNEANRFTISLKAYLSFKTQKSFQKD